MREAEYFPPLGATGPYTAQAFKSSPRQGDMDIHLMYLLAIASAQRSLLIENAYFLPDDLMRKELVDAAKRGAKVEIVVPGEHIATAGCTGSCTGTHLHFEVRRLGQPVSPFATVLRPLAQHSVLQQPRLLASATPKRQPVRRLSFVAGKPLP